MDTAYENRNLNTIPCAGTLGQFEGLALDELISAVQHMPVGMSIIDRNLALKFWNDAFSRILDFPESLMQPGVCLEDLIRFNAQRGDYGPGDPDELVRVRMELARKFEPHRFARERKDGTIVEITGRLIYDGEGQMLGFVTLYQDVTAERRYGQQLEAKNRELQAAYDELKQTQIELLQSAKMASVGHLAAGIAHEINNPIGFVLSDHNALRQDFDFLVSLIDRYEALEAHLPPGQQMSVKEAKSAADLDFIKADMPSLFREIREGLERVKDIVGNLRNFANDTPGDWSEVDVRELLDRALPVAANTFGGRIAVHKHYDEVSRVPCLPSELSQVFLSLLTNAGQAIEGSGTITLSVGEQAGMVSVEIADSGKGIASEDMPHIFDPFFTTQEVGRNRGLGLAVAYSVVKKHGGRIDVVSRSGEGSRFAVRLPVAPPLERAA